MKAWPYNTNESLALAGFKCRGPIACPVCGAEIVIYQIPGHMPVFLDPEKLFPHLEDPPHAEPPWQPPIDGKSAAAGDRG